MAGDWLWRHVPMVDVTLDDTILAVEMREISAHSYQVTHEGKAHQVEVTAGEAGQVNFMLDSTSYVGYVSETEQALTITLDGFNFQLKTKRYTERKRFVHSKGTDVVSDHEITSPMPGKVITLNVQAGDSVKKGDTCW